jgi:hypothetical protein
LKIASDRKGYIESERAGRLASSIKTSRTNFRFQYAHEPEAAKEKTKSQ